MSKMGENMQLQVFVNPEFGEIRCILVDDEPWLVGKDVALVLGYSDTDQALRKHVDSEDKLTRRIDGETQRGNPNIIVINESGLYSLIMSSKLPGAKRFKRWVTSEVLPSIRKTGAYRMPGSGSMSDMDIAMVLARTPKTRLSAVLQFLQARGYDVDCLIESDTVISVERKSGQDCGLQRFVDEIIPQLQRDLQPFGQLYVLYKTWVNANHITGCVPGKNKFIERIARMAELGEIPGWYTKGRKVPVRPKHLMDADEPLLTCYHIAGKHDVLKSTYTGLLRVGSEFLKDGSVRSK